MNNNNKWDLSYSEMLKFKTFKERFEYLKLEGVVGSLKFDIYRYLNQRFYTSSEWKNIRREIIVRDNACDLALPGYELINQSIYIHHINPIDIEDLQLHADLLLNPENLVCVSFETHNAIHYGSDLGLPPVVITRSKGDTNLW